LMNSLLSLYTGYPANVFSSLQISEGCFYSLFDYCDRPALSLSLPEEPAKAV
jgi:hypothetical protein